MTFKTPLVLANANGMIAWKNHYTDILIKKLLFKSDPQQTSIITTFQQSNVAMNTILLMLTDFENCFMELLCGQIKLNIRYKQLKMWTVTTLSGYYLDLFFQVFKMIHSRHCELNSLSLVKHAGQEGLYCGYLPSWNETCVFSKIDITLSMLLHDDTSFQIDYAILKNRRISTYLTVGPPTSGYCSHLFWFLGEPHQRVSLNILANNRTKLLRIFDKHLTTNEQISNKGMNIFNIYMCDYCVRGMRETDKNRNRDRDRQRERERE